MRFWHLYVIVERHWSALRGVLRSKDNVALLQNVACEVGRHVSMLQYPIMRDKALFTSELAR